MSACKTVTDFAILAGALSVDVWVLWLYGALAFSNSKRARAAGGAERMNFSIRRAIHLFFARSGDGAALITVNNRCEGARAVDSSVPNRGGIVRVQKILLGVLIFCALSQAGFGQGIDHLDFNPNPIPDQPGQVSSRVFGTPGTANCTYWVDAVYPQGESKPAGPARESQCPSVLSASDFVQVIWNPIAGALSYNVFKTASAPASGSILLGNTSQNFLDDTGQALSAWTKPASYPASAVRLSAKNGLLGIDGTAIANLGANSALSNLTNPTSLNVPALDFQGAAGITALGSNNPVTLTPSGNANVIIGANGLQFPDASVLLTGSVAKKVATVDLLAQTAAIGTTTLYTPSAQGMFLLCLVPYVNSPTGTSTVSVTVVSVMHGFSVSVPNATTTNATTSQNFRFSTWGFFPDASTNVQYSVTWTSGGAGDSYDLHLVLIQVN